MAAEAGEMETGVGTKEHVAYKLLRMVLSTKPGVKQGETKAKVILKWYAACLSVVKGADPASLKLPNE